MGSDWPRAIRVHPGVLDPLGDVEWGEPDGEGFYSPTIRLQAPGALALPWHRETVGHADIWEIARKITASLSVPLAEGLPPNTDATWIVDSENKVVAFVGPVDAANEADA
jgi:hypothetical protein